MHRHRIRRACAAPLTALALLAGLGATPGRADGEHTRFEMLPVEAILPFGDPMRSPAVRQLALLTLPPGWRHGDAVVMVLADTPGLDAQRDRLVATLLDDGAAVLEFDLPGARGLAADNNTLSAAYGAADLLPELFGALAALHADTGPGLVVAIGFGMTGEAALLATGEAAAARHFGPHGPRFAAAADLSAALPRFAAGAAPPAAERWPQRGALLCTRLAFAAIGTETAEAFHSVAEDCTETLSRPALAAVSAR